MRAGPQEVQGQEGVYRLFQHILRDSAEERFQQQEAYQASLERILTQSTDAPIELRDKLTVPDIEQALNPFQIAVLFGLYDLAFTLLRHYPNETLVLNNPTSLLGIDDKDQNGDTAMHYLAQRIQANKDDISGWTLLNEMMDEEKKRQEVQNQKGDSPMDLLYASFDLSSEPIQAENEIDLVETVSAPGRIMSDFQQALATSSMDLDSLTSTLSKLALKADDPPPIPHAPLRYIAIQGGGAKGAAYPGSLIELSNTGYLEQLRIVAGASAGAISSFIIGLGFDGEQFKTISDNINFLDFNDLKTGGWGSYFGGYKVGIVMDLGRFGAAYTGETFHQWATYLIEQVAGDPNLTFKELHELTLKDPTLKDMIFKATRYRAKKGEDKEQTFSYLHTPDIRVVDALRASMAFPGAFAPWTVRYKDGRKFGTFADGGVLNNYPIDVFNDERFYDEQYRSVQKIDHHGKLHQVNPCSFGLSLTALERLDEEITPFTDRIKQLKKERADLNPEKETQPFDPSTSDPGSALTPEQEAYEKESWGFTDLATGIWWNKIGMALREDLEEKQKLYGDQTIQIYPEEVGTLEFTLSSNKQKLGRIEASGGNATKLWLKKFKDPTTTYHYPERFAEPALSVADKKLKKHNPVEFYKKQLIQHLISFNEEMGLMAKQHIVSDEQILQNVRLQYLSYHINNALDKIRKKEPENTASIVEEAYKTALSNYVAHLESINVAREKRTHLLNPSQIVRRIAEKMQDGKNEEVIRILKGQLSRVIPLMRTKTPSKTQNLLGLIIQNGDAELADQAFNVFSTAVQQCYFQGRTEDLKYSLENMLNEFASPPIFRMLALLPPEKTNKMLSVILKHGADPLAINRETGLNALHEMIQADNFDAFKTLVEYCYAKDAYSVNGVFNNETIMHYLLKNASAEFLKKLIEDPKLKSKISNYQIVDADNNTILELAAMLAREENNLRWVAVQRKNDKFEPIYQSALKKTKESVEAISKTVNYASILLKTDNPEGVINTLSAQDCLRILQLEAHFHSPLMGATHMSQLCALAQQPDKAPLLKLLCEKCAGNSSVSPSFLALLKQKYENQTPLYLAAMAGNADFVSYLRKRFDMEVDNTGPLQSPSALLAAAKKGQSDTVLTILSSTPTQYYFASRRGYNPITLDVTDIKGKNGLHYLAEFGSPEAFCALLFSETVPHPMANTLDLDGKSPLFYLIEHNRMDILKMIIQEGKHRLGTTIYSYDYRFSDIFLPPSNEPNLSDFSHAKRTNPEIYDYLSAHLSLDAKKTLEWLAIIENEAAEEEAKQAEMAVSRSTNLVEIAKAHGSLAQSEERLITDSPIQVQPTRRANYTPQREETRVKEPKIEGKEKERDSEAVKSPSSIPRVKKDW